MKKYNRNHRRALTLLFTGVVLCYLIITLLVVGVTIFMLIQFHVITGPNSSEVPPSRVLIIYVLSSFIVGALLTFFLGKFPLRPVNKLINQMNRLAAGDYRARISYGELWDRHPSVAELTDSFNRLAAELQGTEMLRSDFINNFSHEFKTPIVSIAGFAKLLRRGDLTPEQTSEYLSIIEEESLRLSQMATNVLNLTKVESQTILTDVSALNLSEQLRSCILLLSEKWEKKELDFSLDFDEHFIFANEELLKQVWINLLDNAIKFSPQKGTIGIRVDAGASSLSVSVANSGPDISPENQKRIFNKFYQADKSHSADGNGVGLAIVKRVIDLHDGSISVKSGSGNTEFTVTFPSSALFS